jgi:hypothetical protein
MRKVAQLGFDAYLDAQLHPRGSENLPASAQAQIAALTISQTSLHSLLWDLESTRKNAEAVAGEEGRKAAQQAYQQELTRLAREAASQQVLRAL